MSVRRKIKFVDLFAGIGGFHKALEQVAKTSNYDIECVFVSEIDEESIKTYTENFSFDKTKIINIRNISEDSKEVPEHDFLFAGFPCQTFSNAGKKKGFLDEIRGTLFFEIAKILQNKKPKYILLENVKHLVNHDNGKTWEVITETLTKKLGYIIPPEPLILSPHEFGIPQDRKRVFIPGILKESCNSDIKNDELLFDFNEEKKDTFLNESNPEKARKAIFDNIMEKNPAKKYFLNPENSRDAKLLNVIEAWNVFLKNVKKPEGRTLPVIWADVFWRNPKVEGESPAWKKKYIADMLNIYKINKKFIDKWIIEYDVKNWKRRDQKFEWQAGRDIDDIKKSFIQLRQSGIRCKRPIKFPTLVAMVQIPIVFDDRFNAWRFLTPRETANLQSFPEEYKIHNDLDKNSKDFYSYKQFGNSVNVKIVSLIQQKLLELE